MPAKLLYTRHALKDLSNLPLQISSRILGKLDFFVAQNNPLLFAKKLVDNKEGQYRFRVGDYRVIFDVDSSGNIFILIILTIKHRREAY
ncbi:MAG: type II toxin-antitoxin system RelE/ParE family toxin [Candidatus Magasanikbacteria bacterium]|nr:type II toxin-antitoxin system RelE/ParE family toxin [Candidatus Magasanikbacteria bacterium]